RFSRDWSSDVCSSDLPCETCNGARLKKESLFFKVAEKNIAELCEWNIDTLAEWFDDVEKNLSAKQRIIAKDILKEIKERLRFLRSEERRVGKESRWRG